MTKEERLIYMREYRKKNRERIRQYARDMWKRRGVEIKIKRIMRDLHR